MKRTLTFALILICLFTLIPFSFSQPDPKDITYKPNVIPLVGVRYEDYSFVFEYKSFFIRVRPFIIYNGTYYGMKQIVQFIKNQYPNVDYKWLVDKAVKAVHYGYNFTKLPQNVADKVDYLGFRLIGKNFPLSWFKLETIEIPEEGYNATRIHIPKANLIFSFEDLYPYGYSIEHVNSTYILIGNVKGKTDLFVDPITYSPTTMTIIGGTEGSELDETDIYSADKAGTLQLLEPTQIMPYAQRYALNRSVAPTDELALQLNMIITNLQAVGTLTIEGTDAWNNPISGAYVITNNQTYTTQNVRYRTVTTLYGTGGSNWTQEITQSQWGVIWRHHNQTDNTEHLVEYESDAKFVLGNGTSAGTTWVAFEEMTWRFPQEVLTTTSETFIEVKDYAHLRLGVLDDADAKETSRGVAFFYEIVLATRYSLLIDSSGNEPVYIYSSLLQGKTGAYGQKSLFHSGGVDIGDGGRIYNSILDYTAHIGANSDLYNVDFSNGYYGMATPSTGTMDDLKIWNIYYGIYGFGADMFNVTNVKMSGNTFDFRMGNLYNNNHAYATDTEADWTIDWIYTTSNSRLYSQYTFVVNVTDNSGNPIQNANVTVQHYGEASGQDFTVLTWANGSHPSETLIMGFYNYTRGDNGAIYDYNPYNITITASGYPTYSANFTLDSQIDWTIALGGGEEEYYVDFVTPLAIVSLPVLIGLGLILILNKGKIIKEKDRRE